MTRHRTPVAGAAAVLAVAVIGTGCSGSPPVLDRATPAPVDPSSSTPTATAAPTTEPAPSIRDGDIRDVDRLAAIMAADAAGDAEWIDVFARLRASTWLWSRYPGTYDVLDIYSDNEAGATARASEADWLDRGVYLDEPLPTLVSVVKTRSLGQLTELDVVVDGGIAVVRRVADDRPQGELPGGRARGLFMIARDGPGGRWRIHSFAPLRLVDDPDAEESNP